MDWTPDIYEPHLRHGRDRVQALRRLGLGPNAGPADVRRAFRSLARAHHPDTNPGDPLAVKRFRSLRAAYELLTGKIQSLPDDLVQAAPQGDAGRIGAFPDNDWGYYCWHVDNFLSDFLGVPRPQAPQQHSKKRNKP